MLLTLAKHTFTPPQRGISLWSCPPELNKQGVCGRLKRCLYGTRDAPARWEAFLAKELKKHGFKQGVASACCFYHPGRDIQAVVHGDDFVFVGLDADLAWVEKRMHDSFWVKVVWETRLRRQWPQGTLHP